MKPLQVIRAAAFFCIALMSVVFTAPSIRAQQYPVVNGEKPLADLAQMNGQLKHSPEELERFRGDLTELFKSYREMAQVYAPQKAEALNDVEELLQRLTPGQLDLLRGEKRYAAVVGKTTKELRAAAEKGRAEQSANRGGNPDADYPGCSRPSETVMDVSDTALFVAEGVRDVASRACDQVVVAAGFGGNGSAACIAADAVYVAAKIVNYALHFCSDKYDSAEMEANYKRLGHLHEDLEAAVSNDNANKTAIVNNDNTNKETIVTNDNTNKTAVVNNDNMNKTAIVSNDNANKDTIVTNDNANKAAIVNNDNANSTNIVNNDNANRTQVINNNNSNKNEVKDYTLRLQIELNLAALDTTASVAWFQTPAAKGGYLETARSILSQHIANLGSMHAVFRQQAQSLLAQGDAALASGDYIQAYSFYRKSYRAATGARN